MPSPSHEEPTDQRSSALSRALDGLASRLPSFDSALYAVFAFGSVVFVAAAFYRYMLLQTQGEWSAPLDDVFIHFDYARATARGFPFQWSEGNGYSSGNTSLTYPFVLALGYLIGFRELNLMQWAAVVAGASTWTFLFLGGRLLEPFGRWAKYLLPPAVVSLGALDWTLFSGMENALHLAVWAGMLALVLRLEERIRDGKPVSSLGWATGVVGVFLFFTRPESVVCIAAFGIFLAVAVLRGPGTRAWRRRRALHVLVAIGLPGVLALLLQAAVNSALTGESSANGAIAKLALNNPYMTPLEKWEQYKFLLGYVVLRNTQHHFSDALPWGWLVPLLALAPLFHKKARPYALLLWAQVVGWLLLVAMNGQVRWQNERYTMAAVAWLLVLAAMGLATLMARGRGESKAARALWGARVALAFGCAGIYWVHQAPNFRDQVWFFGRASRNIRDQQYTAGKVLAKLSPRRILVGDAGALLYGSDRPGLDLIGLGGYHKLPFARANQHGLGAALELVERLPLSERPDVMAIYPTWWGDLPGIFGRPLTAIPVVGNVICGGAEKVLYRADWSPFTGSGSPRRLGADEAVLDELDVADLVSEREHDYVFPRPQMGYVSYRVLADPADKDRDLFDAGRDIPAGQRESAMMRMPAEGGRLIVRTVAGQKPIDVEVHVDGRSLGTLHVDAGEGFAEPSLPLPAGLPERAKVELLPKQHGWVNDHVWVVRRGP